MSMPNRAIFREYIGVKPYPNTLRDFPDHIINRNIHEFHFILGFATEGYELGKGTGQFQSNWNVPYISPENVRNLREKFRGMRDKVKVVLSIGGRDPKYPFNPAGRQSTWVENAIRSLKKIIDDYKIDGIDIHYEHIDSSINDFARYMGEVIVGLKAQISTIKVVSIAPSARVPIFNYRKLYQDYKDDIDWVDYQFYSHKVCSNDDFVSLYRQLSQDFDAPKLLVGGSTDPADAANMPREVFIEGVRYLVNNESLPGAFVWNANDSAAYPQPSGLEETIQAILTH